MRARTLQLIGFAAIFGLLAVTLSGCAVPARDGGAERRQMDVMAKRLTQTRAEVQRLRGEVSRLKGRLDELSYRTKSLPSTMDPLAEADLEREGGFVAASPEVDEPDPYQPMPTQPGNEAMGMGAPIQETPTMSEVQRDMARGNDPDYVDGLRRFEKGDYTRAALSLRRFASKHPRDELVPNAQFWIGEAYFAQRKYNEAILAYNEILVGWPRSTQVPTALLRQATAFAQLGDKIDARLILKKLIEDHPSTNEAAEAKEQLRALGA